MKKISFLAICLSALAFGSCIKDADISTPDVDQSTTVGNTSFSFKIQNSDASTKAVGTVEDSGYYEQGFEQEYQVNNVTVYMFDATGEELVYTFELHSIDLDETSSDDTDIYYTSAAFDIDEGMYNIFAVANGASGYTGSDQAGFLAYVDQVTYNTGLISSVPSSGFVMTNRGAENLNVIISKDSDVAISMTLERVVAKVSVSQNSDYFELKDNNGDVYATVRLIQYQLVNLSTNYYLYRHVADLSSFAAPALYDAEVNFGDVSDDNGYVIDPYFFSKDVDKVDSFTNADGYFANFLSDVSNNSAWIDMKEYETLSTNYCLENTLYVDAQVNGYTTGVVFSATVTPTVLLSATGTNSDTGTSPKYYCNYKFYDSIESLLARLGGNICVLGTGDVICEDTPTDDLEDLNIIRLENDKCYYNYWIRHYDNENVNIKGVMEFGVVRNNYYKIAVNSIGSVGTGEPEVEMSQFDETDETIAVDLNVVPWIIRAQGDIELN